MNTRKCKDWNRDRSVNPETNRQIKNEGPVYKKLEMLCNENMDDCEKWKKAKIVNPKTLRRIKIDGPIYNIYTEKCYNFTKSQNKNVSKINILNLPYIPLTNLLKQISNPNDLRNLGKAYPGIIDKIGKQNFYNIVMDKSSFTTKHLYIGTVIEIYENKFNHFQLKREKKFYPIRYSGVGYIVQCESSKLLNKNDIKNKILKLRNNPKCRVFSPESNNNYGIQHWMFGQGGKPVVPGFSNHHLVITKNKSIFQQDYEVYNDQQMGFLIQNKTVVGVVIKFRYSALNFAGAFNPVYVISKENDVMLLNLFKLFEKEYFPYLEDDLLEPWTVCNARNLRQTFQL